MNTMRENMTQKSNPTPLFSLPTSPSSLLTSNFLGYKFVEVKGEPTPIDTCLGGVPYLPHGVKMPKGEVLYVQINFDIDKVELSGFPTTGILQFFIPQAPSFGEEYGTARYYETIDDNYQKDIIFQPNNRVYTPTKVKLKKVENKIYGIGISGIGGIVQTCQSRIFGKNGTDLWFGMDTDSFGLQMLGDCGIIACYADNEEIKNGTKLKEFKEKGEIKICYYGDCH